MGIEGTADLATSPPTRPPSLPHLHEVALSADVQHDPQPSGWEGQDRGWHGVRTSLRVSTAACSSWLCAHATVVLLSLALLSWSWALLAGVAALTISCHHYTSAQNRKELMMASGMVYLPACSKTFSCYWFLVSLQLAAVVWGYIACRLTSAKSGALVLLAVIATLLMKASKNFLDLHYVLDSSTLGTSNVGKETLHAANCALAGGILCSIFDALSCISLGWRHDCQGSGTPMVEVRNKSVQTEMLSREEYLKAVKAQMVGVTAHAG